MKQNLTIAIRAALDAGKEIMEVYTTNFEVEHKGDDSPLTIADKNANDIIINYLEPTGIPIISEETKQLDFIVRQNWNECWIVDPLDGTKEFIKRNGEFTVNIALVRGSKPVLGVIYIPVSRTLYFSSEEGDGAFKIVVDDDQADILSIVEAAQKVYPTSEIAEVVRVVGSRSHLNAETEAFISEINREKEVEIVSKGSSFKFCLVAEGLADVYPRFAPTMEWDTAAGQAICEAVGLRVIDNETKENLKYNKQNLLNNYFLVKK